MGLSVERQRDTKLTAALRDLDLAREALRKGERKVVRLDTARAAIVRAERKIKEALYA